MDSMVQNDNPRRVWWQDVRRVWPIYVAGLFAMLITNGTEVLAPKTLQWIIDALISTRHTSSSKMDGVFGTPEYQKILSACGIFLGVAILGMFGRVFWRFTLARMTHVFSNEMKQDLWTAIRSTSLERAGQFSFGDLMNRAIGDVNSARWIYGFTIVLTCDVVFFTVLGSVAMMMIHLKLALACLAMFVLVPFTALKLAKLEYQAHERARSELTTLSENVSQAIRGVRAQRASQSFGIWVESMTDSARRYAALSLMARRIAINSYPVCSLPTIFSYVVLFTWGPVLVANHEISVGQFAAMASYVYLFQGPLAEIGDLVAEWQKGFASLKRISEIRRLPPAVPSTIASHEISAHKYPSEIIPLIEISDLGVTRNGHVVFQGVGFELHRGEWFGLRGKVGSGKTTLLQSVAGLIPFHSGMIRVSGRPSLPLSVRAKHGDRNLDIVYAPEKPFVFSGTIRHNLCLNQEFSDQQLWHALDVVCLGQEIRCMHDGGLEKLVGEGGVTLSGGQRQRLALARIILRASNVILLDDPLSAVDASTEAKIMANLREIWRNFAVMITSNKPAALTSCDRVATLSATGITFDVSFQGMTSDRDLLLNA